MGWGREKGEGEKGESPERVADVTNPGHCLKTTSTFDKSRGNVTASIGTIFIRFRVRNMILMISGLTAIYFRSFTTVATRFSKNKVATLVIPWFEENE